MNKFVIQIINAENGNRSKPYEANWDQLAESLKKAESINSKDYILLVAAIEGEEEQMQIPQSPLITIETFLSMFDSEQQHVAAQEN